MKHIPSNCQAKTVSAIKPANLTDVFKEAVAVGIKMQLIYICVGHQLICVPHV